MTAHQFVQVGPENSIQIPAKVVVQHLGVRFDTTTNQLREIVFVLTLENKGRRKHACQARASAI